MSEIMRPMPFGQLMTWAMTEYRAEGRVFGVRKEKFFKNDSGTEMEIFGTSIPSAIGPAAGPNSQLAQNIIAAYLAGSRFVELKTVQKMDGKELRDCVPRPCIKAEDECYNVEWSTELTVPQAYAEYVKAWVAIHALGKELGLSDKTDFVFNQSAGYDLDGIKTEKIDSYIEGMKNAAGRPDFEEAVQWLKDNADLFETFTAADAAAIPAGVSNSVTLSTLHGCPPQEIERISKYLLEEKKVHTFVKCNPTLLGYETARRLLDEMGFTYVSFDEHHFNDDLQYGDAVAMLGRLMEYAKERGLSFGVKITNTFPVEITKKELPGEEMYMSGRALFPLSINVAQKLAQDFDGKLPISYSGGADAFNIEDIYKTGIRPITVATTILKPGGYERMKQLAAKLAPMLKREWDGIDKAALTKLATTLPTREFYRKEKRTVGSRKTESPLGLFDCFMAPCRDGGCPIGQQVPEYLKMVCMEEYGKAFDIIAIDNAAPGVTGEICNHNCQSKCTRMDYDESLHIRASKRMASEKAQKAFTDKISAPALKTDKKAVVIGAGPAGIAAALFLRRNGVAVTVLEKREKPFGIVQYVIPAFRISDDAMQRDYQMAVNMGVEFQFGVAGADPAKLKGEYDFVIIATGAWKEGAAAVEKGQELLLDALAFLEESKKNGCNVTLGKRVAVVGGGDVAMDCARAAKRAPGVENVTLVYRRTREFMPASPEEIDLAIADGVDVLELYGPKTYDGKTLTCEVMELSDYDASGRRGIKGTGVTKALAFDKVISAVGARVDSAIFEAAGLELDAKKRPVVSGMKESSVKGVYVAGDCREGPATVVRAIADAKAAAIDILIKLGLPNDFVRVASTSEEFKMYERKGVLAQPADMPADNRRCLGCDVLCELCVDVCPNRANVRVKMDGFKNSAQILHVDAMCNECGNCGVFCPHSGNPYKDKVTVFGSVEDFKDSENRGFAKLSGDEYLIRLAGGETVQCGLADARVPKDLSAFIAHVCKTIPYVMPM